MSEEEASLLEPFREKAEKGEIIVQALETFHSCFFYDDKEENYVELINRCFGDN